MKDDDNHILLLEKGKRGLLQIIFGRTGIIIVSLIVQILFLFAAFYKLEGFLPYFWGGNTLLSAAVVLFLFGNDDNPTIKLTWFFILAVLPVFGLILYVYIKTDLGHRLMIRRYNDILSQTEHFAPSESACSKEELPEELQSLASYLNSCGFPCYQNTQAQYFPLGDDAFAVMCDELQKAEHFIFLEYFIVREGYMWGRILEILKEKVNAGIEVRVLYDGTCAVALLPYSYPEKLEKLGIACKMFAPLRPFVSTHYNYRDHRKIMVIDGKIGFTGGINLSDEYINRTSRLGHWKDTAIALRGDAVRSLTADCPDNVFYVKRLTRDEIKSLMAQCTCLVCASRDDPMPTFVTEGLIFGKPAIVSEHTGTAGLITEGVDGFVYEDDDPEKLAERLAWAIDHPEKLAAMRQACRDLYERHYSKQAFADGLKQAVRELTGESTLSLCQN